MSSVFIRKNVAMVVDLGEVQRFETSSLSQHYLKLVHWWKSDGYAVALDMVIDTGREVDDTVVRVCREVPRFAVSRGREWVLGFETRCVEIDFGNGGGVRFL